MVYFILGFSITLNILFILILIIALKFLKNKKDSLDFIVDKDVYDDFIKQVDILYMLFLIILWTLLDIFVLYKIYKKKQVVYEK